MSYVDAGYGIALGVLALYALTLWHRRRRLQRAVARAGAGAVAGDPVEATAGGRSAGAGPSGPMTGGPSPEPPRR